VFGIDNGAFSYFDEAAFTRLLRRELPRKQDCLFVCVPDKVGDHIETLIMWEQYKHLAEGWRRAFVVQDGFTGAPPDADVLFIGGTTAFKDSREVEQIVCDGVARGVHVHVGRVNGAKRFWKFRALGAHTCDGSGVSRFDHMLEKIRDFRS